MTFIVRPKDANTNNPRTENGIKRKPSFFSMKNIFFSLCLIGFSSHKFLMLDRADKSSRRRLAAPVAESKSIATSTTNSNNNKQFRVLHVVTSLSEYDTGTRGTSHGDDRLSNILIPVLQDAVTSVQALGWHIDVYLILGYKELKPHRRKLISDALPPNVKLTVWEDAMPYWYPHRRRNQKPAQNVELATHALSRQHRYVVKDLIDEYDFFSCFEDDMRITGDHMEHFLKMSNELDRLRHLAEASPDGLVRVNDDNAAKESPKFPSKRNDVMNAPFTAEALRHAIPGFLRVETLDDSQSLSNSFNREKNGYMELIPTTSSYQEKLNPVPCCHVGSNRKNQPASPGRDDVILWESNISAFGVRKYPGSISWVGAMPVEDRADVGSYWSGFTGLFGNMVRPRRRDATLGQQAGWMATREQVLYFHEKACPGGFLPPYDHSEWKGNDGMYPHAVEFWSGGFQLFGKCFLNRILSMDPEQFSKQLLFHTSNNKQRTKGKDKFIRAGDFLGQLHTVARLATDGPAALKPKL